MYKCAVTIDWPKLVHVLNPVVEKSKPTSQNGTVTATVGFFYEHIEGSDFPTLQ